MEFYFNTLWLETILYDFNLFLFAEAFLGYTVWAIPVKVLRVCGEKVCSAVGDHQNQLVDAAV